MVIFMFDSATWNNNNCGPGWCNMFQRVPLFTCTTSKKQADITTGPQIVAVFPHKSEIFARSEMDLHNHVLFLFGPVVIYLTAST